LIVIVSGPGGVGKGTLVRELLRRDPALWLSRSWTSRAPRPGDPNDEKYVFVDRAAFEARVAEGGFLEWAEFTGNYYGTPTLVAPAGRDVVLEIELQGAQQVRRRHPDALLLFVLPPTRAEQERRLRQRGDTDDKVDERIRKAAEEEPIGRALADHLVVNDDLDATVERLASLVRTERLRRGLPPGSPRRLPRRDVVVTALGFGGAPIGDPARGGEAEALAAVDEAWEAGVRYFDTAPLYGHGLSEHRLGRALRGRPRDEFTLSTKVGRLLTVGAAGGSEAEGLRPVADFSADGARRSLEASLDRLGLDHVDIVYVHDPDDHLDQAVAETVPALVDLRDQGVVRAVGAGMHHAGRLAELVRRCDLDVVLCAGRYSLLDQSAAEELLPACEARGVGVVIGRPFNSGVLADPSPNATFDGAPAPAAVVERARALAAVCAGHGVDLRAAALQFPLGHPAVVSVLAGVRDGAEMRADAGFVASPLPAPLWAELGVAYRFGQELA
jgi:D-threo-aldose 1-dehydrogenase